MTEHDRDQDRVAGQPADESRHERRQITGLCDLLPDWLLPQEAKQHVRNARKELLLAVRSMLDTAIERQEAAPTPRRTVSRVQID